MAGFDDGGVFFSDNFGSENTQDESQINLQAIKRRFRDFFRQFHEGNFNYRYRDQLKQHYNMGQYWLEVSMEDISSFDEVLADKLSKQPTEHLPLVILGPYAGDQGTRTAPCDRDRFTMAGFDDGGVFFSDNFGSENTQDESQINLQAIKRRFRDFFRQFHEGNFNYRYRDQLKQHYNMGQYWLEVSMEDISSFDEVLADKLSKQPTEHLPLLEEAAKEVVDEITRPRPEGEEDVADIQVLLKSDAHPIPMRDIKSDQVSKLVKVPGIVIAASGIKAKATSLTLQCRSCRETVPNIPVKPGLEGYALPRRCNSDRAGQPRCPQDPFFIVPDKCKCVDFQVLKLQEVPEEVPYGEMPRHLQLYCERYLCERVVPGNRITAIGVYSIKKQGTGRSRVLLRNTLGVACILSHQHDMGTCVLSYKKTYNVISGPS
ncbi:DNA replication licensing factor mcm5 [Ixodes scapularis]